MIVIMVSSIKDGTKWYLLSDISIFCASFHAIPQFVCLIKSTHQRWWYIASERYFTIKKVTYHATRTVQRLTWKQLKCLPSSQWGYEVASTLIHEFEVHPWVDPWNDYNFRLSLDPETPPRHSQLLIRKKYRVWFVVKY